MTRCSYESGISIIAEALNANEAMVMVSNSLSIYVMSLYARIYKPTYKKLIGQVINKYLKFTVYYQI